MLSNKKLIFFLNISIILVFYSCGGNVKNKNKDKIAAKYKEPGYVLTQAKKILGDNTKFAYSGKFDDKPGVEVSAGTELNTSNGLGIKFYLLNLQDNNLVTSYQTKVLNGSFHGSIMN